MAAGKPQGKRERIDTKPEAEGGARFVRRDREGQFTTNQVDVGRSISDDKRQAATAKAPKGQKDRGD